jgi:hypothetical protein
VAKPTKDNALVHQFNVSSSYIELVLVLVGVANYVAQERNRPKKARGWGLKVWKIK